jgi:shikimate dehydrogenase
MPAQFGLIGQSLSHSFSKVFFTDYFLQQQIDAGYNNYEAASIQDVEQLLQTTSVNCFNVTIPYKQSIVPLLAKCTPAATQILAVNCIKKIDNQWHGTNTDIDGFWLSFAPHLQQHHTHALIIGNGGAAQAVKFVLRKMNIPFAIVTRSSQIGAISFADLTADVMAKYSIVINTTPLGMHPNELSSPPIPYQYITSQHYLYDLVYNPTETIFLAHAKSANAIAINGLQMLEKQALAAWQWWNE